MIVAVFSVKKPPTRWRPVEIFYTLHFALYTSDEFPTTPNWRPVERTLRFTLAFSLLLDCPLCSTIFTDLLQACSQTMCTGCS